MICRRCKEYFGTGENCTNCGVHKDRRVMSLNSARRSRKATGKRGRNSGKVSQHGKKK